MNQKTMKFSVGALALTVLLTTAATVTGAAAAGKGADAISAATSKQTQTQSQYIGIEAAQKAALKHAGVEAKAATFTEAKLDTGDDGTAVYDVKFNTTTARYDYEIGAVDSSVWEHEKKVISSKPQTAQPKQTVQPTDGIGVEAAKKAALKHAGFSESQVTALKAELDREDGVWVYEVEFDKGGMEYDYELDAKTGTVLTWESDWD